jgi:hypothetical protein
MLKLLKYDFKINVEVTPQHTNAGRRGGAYTALPILNLCAKTGGM